MTETIIEFVPLEESHLEEIRLWHQDPTLSSRYGGSDWPDKMLELARKDDNRHCLIAGDGDRIIGYVDFEIDPAKSLGWIGLVVAPSVRGTGYGTRLLTSFKSSKLAGSVSELRAGIEEDNLASIKCFEKAGFRQLGAGPDEEGCLIFASSPLLDSD